ncbi:MAG: hypothetical protein NTU57_02555 [Candidatus Aenigmarchaeota archaeon]|nr:hypothetical protein [Candidatus Aenigmarchaeota archaeon]
MPYASFSLAPIGKEMKISRQVMSKYKKRLAHIGLIKRILPSWPPMYRLTEKAKKLNVNDFSYSTTTVDIDEKIGMEDVFITIPIADKTGSNLPEGFWEKINLKLNNNVQKHGHVNLGDYTCSIRETSKSVIIQLGPVRLQDFKDAIPIYNELVMRLYQLLIQYNYFIDPFKARCSDPEFTYSNVVTRENAKEITEPRVTEYLGFPREKMLPGDQPEETWVKGDNSPDTGTIESNHRPLAAAWRAFPLAIHQLLQLQTRQTEIMGKYAAEIEAHLDTYAKVNVAFEKNNALTADVGRIAQGFTSALDSFKQALSEVRTPAPQKRSVDTVLSDLQAMQPWERVRVRIIQNIRDFTFTDESGASRKVDHLKAGSEIYLARDQAIDVVTWKEAELV